MKLRAKTENNPYWTKLGPEDSAQVRIVEYVKDKGLVIMHTPNESKKTAWERFYAKVMGIYPSWPDLFLPYARKGFHGLYIEMKSENNPVYNRDGSIRKDKLTQWATLQMLTNQGYLAEFAVGYDEAKQIFDKYFEE